MKSNEKKEKLLTEFEVPTYEQWMELVEKQLKGAPFEKKLVKRLYEGFSIQPIYRKEDELKADQSLPGAFPFTRSTKVTGQVEDSWKVTQHYYYPLVNKFNEAITYDIERGLDSISFALDKAGQRGLDPDASDSSQIGRSGVSICSSADLDAALSGIDLTKVPLLIQPGSSYLAMYSLLSAYAANSGLNVQQIKGSLVADPLSIFATEGELPRPLNQLYDEMASMVSLSANASGDFSPVGISMIAYAESGATALQELSIGLASAAEYLRAMVSRGISMDDAAGSISFFVALSSDFFKNIAKVRAFRSLWANLVKAFGGDEQSQKVKLHAFTKQYNKTVHDPYVNLLRATTEAYAGVLAGCDSISVSPFNEVYSLPDEISRRISRNIQIILKEECHGHKVIDPAGGSWFVESLTENMAKEAWKEFQNIESKGGLLASLKEGYIQEKIGEVVKSKKADVATRKSVIIGTNMFPDLEESSGGEDLPDFEAIALDRKSECTSFKTRRKNVIDLDSSNHPDSIDSLSSLVTEATNKGATLGELSLLISGGKKEEFTIQPLSLDRLASDFEELRKKAAEYKSKQGSWPKIFLTNIGPLRQHKARADFTAGFVQPGGFETIYSDGFDTVGDAVQATLNSKASICVICSTDDTYPDLVPDFTKQVKSNNPDMMVVVAGFPKDHIDAFKDAGVDEFIHLKANNLELLKKFQTHAGV